MHKNPHDSYVPVSMIIPLAIGAAAVICTFFYASFRDVKERRVPFATWYPMLAIAVPMVIWFYMNAWIQNGWEIVVYFLILTLLFSAIFYFFAWMNLFGGADAWALIFLCVSIPAFPIEPATGYPPLGFLPFTVLVNALILNFLTPLGLFIKNLLDGQRAPFPYMFLGFPLPADELPRAYGFIMEEIDEDGDDMITRRFIRPGEAIQKMVFGKKRVYTKDLRLHPENYTREISLFRKAGHVWISYGIPFIVPLTAGLISALFVGDILFLFMKFLAGV